MTATPTPTPTPVLHVQPESLCVTGQPLPIMPWYAVSATPTPTPTLVLHVQPESLCVTGQPLPIMPHCSHTRGKSAPDHDPSLSLGAAVFHRDRWQSRLPAGLLTMIGLWHSSGAFQTSWADGCLSSPPVHELSLPLVNWQITVSGL